MAELRHSTAAAAASRASNSPAKRDSDASASSSPFASTSAARGRDDDDDDDGKDAHRSSPLLPQHHHHKQLLPSPLRSLLALEDPRPATASLSYRILLAILALLLLAALFSVPSLWSRFVSSPPPPPSNTPFKLIGIPAWHSRFCIVSHLLFILERALLVPEGGDNAALPSGEVLLDLSKQFGDSCSREKLYFF
jgi:hypothetical protein